MTAAPTTASPLEPGSTTIRANPPGGAGNASILPDALRAALEQAQAQVNGLVLGKAQAVRLAFVAEGVASVTPQNEQALTGKETSGV